MKQTDYIVVLIMAGSLVEAENIADILVTGKLAACVNVVPEVKSVFSWKGKVEKEKEVLLIVKSKSSVFKELVEKVREAHKYDVPEIIALPVIDGSGHYLEWLEKEIKE